MKMIKITKVPGAFRDVSGSLVSPMPGNEIPVTDDMAKTMINGGFAEEVKQTRKAKADSGPEETR